MKTQDFSGLIAKYMLPIDVKYMLPIDVGANLVFALVTLYHAPTNNSIDLPIKPFRLKTQVSRCGIFVPCIFLFALLTFSLLNNTVYGVEDQSRRNMSERADTALEEILSAKEFRIEEEKPPWWYKLVERIFNLLPEDAGLMSTVVEWIFYSVMIIVIVAGSIFLAKRLGKLPSFTTSHNIPVETQDSIDAEAVRMQAYEFSRTGDYRQAIRYLYLSLLLYLDKAGMLTYDTSKTDAEYVSEARRSMENEAERFNYLALLFQRKWYGMEKSSPGDFRQCEEIFARLTGSG